MKHAVTICIVLMALLLVAIPVLAQEQTDTDKRITELEKKIEQLLKEKETPKLKLMNNEEQDRALEPVGLTNFYDNGYLVASSADGSFKYWLDGRVNLDFATYSGAENRLPSGFEVRRARIGVKATLYKDWLAEVDLDFADNAIEMKDLWAGYAGFDNSIIRLGNHKAPFGLETLTSSKYITFIERSYLDSWAPDRLLGASYSRWGKNWQVSAGGFGQAGGAFNDKDSLTGGGAGTSQEMSLVARGSWAPINQKGRVLHVGLAAAHMKPEVGKITTSGADLVDRVNAARIVKLDSRAETHVLRAKFLSTGDMKYVDNYDLKGLELAGVYGPFSFQGEYQTSKVNREETTVAVYKDHEFSGYYGFVSWFPTGESRPYSASEGEFGRIIPKNKWGAVELALRYSNLDLNDITSADPIKGGSANNLTLGACWYINANHRILVNITKVDNDEYAKPGKDWAPLPAGTSTTMTPVYGDDFTTLSMRYQIAF
jgi:phosphate-selective porin OprO/OprP